MACMCGDTHCPSCGPAQGYSHCEACGAWVDKDGCKSQGCKRFVKELDRVLDDLHRKGAFDDYTGPDPNGKYPCDSGESPCGCSKCNPKN